MEQNSARGPYLNEPYYPFKLAQLQKHKKDSRFQRKKLERNKFLVRRKSKPHKKLKGPAKRRPAQKKNFKQKAKSTRKPARQIKKITKQQIIASKKLGYKIPYIKRGGFFSKMNLKKGDVIKSFARQTVSSKKQIYQMLYPLLKNKTPFSALVRRNKKDFLISYKIIPYKTKKKLIISGIKRIKDSAHPTKDKTTKKSLVPKRYKPFMQRAYVLASNSFVYQKPDFDSLKLYPLPIGKKVLISKKIFRPTHNFGSFYKVFLFSDKKIVGYISEAEVAPEFLKQKEGYINNPAYKAAKEQKKQNKVLDIDLIEQAKPKSQNSKPKQKKLKNEKKRYVGLSAGFFTSGFDPPSKETAHIGLKLSGYNLLISYLNMDLNLSSTLDGRLFYLDILTAYPLIKSPPYHFFLSGGLMGNLKLDETYRMTRDSMDFGLAGAVSLIIPINKKLSFRTEMKTGYYLKGHFSWGLSSSLQIGF